MSLRTRLTLVAAAAVAVAIALAAGGTYFAAKSVLRGEVDDALRARASLAEVRRAFGGEVGIRLPAPELGAAAGVAQLVPADEPPIPLPGDDVLFFVDERAREVAAGERDEYFEERVVDGIKLRLLTTPIAPGYAIQVALPIEEMERTLRRLAVVLVLFALGGIALAAVLGRIVARTALAPVEELSEAAQHVASTQDLTRRMEARGGGELATLARSFNTMLEALDQSVQAQRQLVADASHELRTPLTSLRTNVELLARPNGLPKAERERMLGDALVQLEELTALMNDVVELARGAETGETTDDVELDALVAESVERAQRHSPGVTFVLQAEPTTVHGDAARIARAVGNLLDNAAKWSPPDGVVDVDVHDGEVTVRDRGPGIAPSDLPHVFDRFYRAPAARGKPGSGLGLAIARQVAEGHGATIAAANAPDGGAVLRLRFLVTP